MRVQIDHLMVLDRMVLWEGKPDAALPGIDLEEQHVFQVALSDQARKMQWRIGRTNKCTGILFDIQFNGAQDIAQHLLCSRQVVFRVDEQTQSLCPGAPDGQAGIVRVRSQNRFKSKCVFFQNIICLLIFQIK